MTGCKFLWEEGNSEAPCYLIGEIGVNHNGDLPTAVKMVDLAVDVGLDAVKIQSFSAGSLASSSARASTYQIVNMGYEKPQLDFLSELELTFEEQFNLKKYCDARGIDFISTPFDFQSAEMLEKIGVAAIKISSGDITHHPLLKLVSRFQLPIILSTGMADLKECEDARNVILQSSSDPRFATLHCVSQYPAPETECNLLSLQVLRESIGCPVGWSDHTTGYTTSILALALGAQILEKHFTLSKDMEGPDHIASASPQEIKQYVQTVRATEKTLGTREKKPAVCETENRLLGRRSICLNKQLPKGHIIALGDLAFLRPGSGIGPENYDKICGMELKSDKKPFEPLTYKDVDW